MPLGSCFMVSPFSHLPHLDPFFNPCIYSIQVSKARVEALLQLAVQSSVANLDPFKDDLCVAFSHSSMIQHLEAIHAKDGSSSHASLSAASSSSGSSGASISSSSSSGQLKGIEVFMVDYKVAWPVSLVVSKRSLTKYQLVFRHLFFARHVERCLKQTWQGQQRLKELDVRAAGGRSYCLRHRMLGFMQDIVYYFTYEVRTSRSDGGGGVKGKLKALRRNRIVDFGL